MANDPIREMIAAFASGCIDNENFAQFKDYLYAGGELPVNELGELQNIVSMIPIILDLETPDPMIKDSIAKKLIGMQDEIKTRIREERRRTSLTFSRTNIPQPVATKETINRERENKTLTKTHTEKHPTFSKTLTREPDLVPEAADRISTKNGERMSTLTPQEPQTLFPQTKRTPLPEPEEKYSGGVAGWIAIVLTIILFTILGYYTYTSVEELNYEIEELKSNITTLKSDLAASNNFMSNYNALIEFFNYKDLSVTNLSTTDPADKATARLLLAFDQKEGLVQFKNAKSLQPNQGFQLWVVSKNLSYSLGVYTPAGSEYIRLTTFPFVPKELIDMIKVTIESETGSPTPSVQNYMTGSLRR